MGSTVFDIARLQGLASRAWMITALSGLLLVLLPPLAQGQQKSVGKEAPGKEASGKKAASQRAAGKNQSRPAAAFAPTPWRVQCASTPSGKVACALGRAVVELRSRQVLWRVSISGDRKRMVLQLPHGLDLRKPLEVLVDDKPVGKAVFFTSRVQGAFAEMALSKQQLASLSKGKALALRARVLAGRPLVMRMGLKGFAAALTKLR